MYIDINTERGLRLDGAYIVRQNYTLSLADVGFIDRCLPVVAVGVEIPATMAAPTATAPFLWRWGRGR